MANHTGVCRADRLNRLVGVAVIKLLSGLGLWAYLGIAAAVLASVGGYAYYRGAISQAEKVGRLTAEISKLKSDVQAADGKTIACHAVITAQNDKITRWKEEADLRIAEAAKAAQAARIVAQTYKDRARNLSQQRPSRTCEEAAQRFRQQLQSERK